MPVSAGPVRAGGGGGGKGVEGLEESIAEGLALAGVGAPPPPPQRQSLAGKAAAARVAARGPIGGSPAPLPVSPTPPRRR